MPRSRAMALLNQNAFERPIKSTTALIVTRRRDRISKQAMYTYAIINPDISHDLVKDFTLKITETSLTVASTSVSKILKICPNADLSSAACNNVIKVTTTASCTNGNLTMLRIGAVSSLIRSMVPPGTGQGRASAQIP